MSSITKSPSYLIRNSSSYCFRLVIPKDLRPIICKTELRYSLRTGSLSIAKHRARLMASYVHRLFIELRSKKVLFLRNQELNKKTINESLKKYFKKVLEEDEEYRVSIRRIKTLDNIEEETYCFLRTDAMEDLAKCIHKKGEDILKFALEEEVSLDENSLLFKLGALLNNLVNSSDNLQQEEFESIKLSKLIDKYVAEKKRTNAWCERSLKENPKILKILIEVLGDIKASQINHSTMNKFKETLLKLPKKRETNKKYKNKTIKEIIQMDIPDEEKLHITTINKIFDHTSSLFNYAVRHGYMKENYAKGLKLREKNKKDKRQPFTDEDLYKIFHFEDYVNGNFGKPYMYWIPILALMTGARLEELAQLHKEDIKKIDDIWVIDINSNGEKKLKTLASERKVPIHPFLIKELGFIDFIKSVKHDRLFPELRKIEGRYGHYITKWFGRLRKKLNIQENKTFHSFRHTFINTAKQKGINDTKLKEVVGHSVKDITMGHYAKRFKPEILLKDVILKVGLEKHIAHLAKKSL
ncbi:site-specific integrase [Desulfohalobiaceae bacterium Ax17]|uniref:site-specific integrase n=1 Tax=Desulfovulcanus ferrireducens TaxID=2831190 RepID=UPI00207BC1B4|nr:site-specific integrase [Desulfovulcanus ferrireducens]MBT8762474.1 site-specific integrase [Desulfovulcanus ferrireducens]